MFDTTANLVWCGDALGNAVSFTPSLPEPQAFTNLRLMPLYRYTKFNTLDRTGPVLQLLNHLKGVLSLLNHCISFTSRTGLPKQRITPASLNASDSLLFRNLTCMSLAYTTSTDLVVGGKSSLFRLDLNKPALVLHLAYEGSLSFINYSSKLLTLGSTTGSLDIFDPVFNKTVNSFAGHSGLLSDLAVKGNYVATCGYSARTKRYGSAPEYMVDPLVNIFDLRTMRPLSPVPFSAGASFVRFHPKLPNIIIIASTTGQIQFIDMYDSLEVHLYQADVAGAPNSLKNSGIANNYLSNLDVSENGEFLCFGDGNKNMHLWSLTNSTNRNFLNFPSSLEQPDVTDFSVTRANCTRLDDNVPLNMIGMPYYKDYLASNFPHELTFIKESSRVPSTLAEEILASAPPQLFKNTDSRQTFKILPYSEAQFGRRYAIQDYESLKSNGNKKAGRHTKNTGIIPKFISERNLTASPVPSLHFHRFADAESPSLPSNATFNDLNDSESVNDNNETYFDEETMQGNGDTVFAYKAPTGAKVPSCYTKLEIRYSKFGVDDFDFDYYNRSGGLYAGLENHSDNSYTNPLIQLYRYIPIFYNSVTEGLLEEFTPSDRSTIHDKRNPQGSSILNELAYLFDMMHHAKAKNVSISNFSLILNESEIANSHGLINKDDTKSLNAHQLQQLIVTFNKFLVESIVADFRVQTGANIQDMTSMYYELSFYNLSGGLVDKQYGNQATLDLITPPPQVLNPSVRGNLFLLKKNVSILTYLEFSLNQQRMIPANANSKFDVEVRQTLLRVGPVLLINMAFSDQEFSIIRGFKKWLVPEFYLTSGGNRVCFKPMVTQLHQAAEKYELQGYVCQISRGPNTRSGDHHLVSYVKLKSPALGKDQWFLFNDFLVMPVPEEEVYNLSYVWKKPVVVVYHNVEDPRNQNFKYFEAKTFLQLLRLNDSILYRDHFAYGIREGHRKEYELLTREEAPVCGSLIAIDAEFVSLKPEVAEVSFRGYKNLVRPTVLSLARVSALRGNAGPKRGVPFMDDYILHCKPIYDFLTTFSGIEETDLDPARSQKTLVTLQTAYRKLWLLLNLGCVFVGHGLKSDFRCINLQVPKHQIRDTIEYYYLLDFKRKLSLKFLAYTVLKESVQTRNHDSIEDAHTALLLYEKYMELRAQGEFELELRRIYLEGQQLRFRAPDN